MTVIDAAMSTVFELPDGTVVEFGTRAAGGQLVVEVRLNDGLPQLLSTVDALAFVEHLTHHVTGVAVMNHHATTPALPLGEVAT